MVTDLLDDDGLLNLGKPTATTPSQNDALRQWAQPSGPQTDKCHLCGRPPRLTCQACGRGACGADSWVMLGLCRRCATEDRMKAWHRDRDVSENWLG